MTRRWEPYGFNSLAEADDESAECAWFGEPHESLDAAVAAAEAWVAGAPGRVVDVVETGRGPGVQAARVTNESTERFDVNAIRAEFPKLFRRRLRDRPGVVALGSFALSAMGALILVTEPGEWIGWAGTAFFALAGWISVRDWNAERAAASGDRR